MANSTGPKPAFPLHTEHIHVERKQKPKWLWLLLCLTAVGLLAGVFMATRNSETAVSSSTTHDAVVVAHDAPRLITYKDSKWEVKGTPATFLANEVELIGKSEEGDALYFNPEKGYTSAKGSTYVKDTISTPSGRVYLKNPDGRYQPLFVKH